MKLKTVTLCALLSVSCTGFASQAAKNGLNNEVDKLSYTFGANMGQSFKQQDVKINPKLVYKGLEDAMTGKDLLMTKEQMNAVLTQFQKDMIIKQEGKIQKDGADNKQKGEAFLANNKKQKDIVTTASGLQYKVIKEGKGKHPMATDEVTVEYTGKLIDGTVFDSTDKNGKPVSFNVSGVIQGWTEALKLMRPGAEWEVFVPSDLAYGSRGMGGPIGPNETLIFNIHLISVQKGDKS